MSGKEVLKIARLLWMTSWIKVSSQHYSGDLNTSHLNTTLHWSSISNGRFMCYIPCTRPTIQLPEQYTRKKDFFIRLRSEFLPVRTFVIMGYAYNHTRRHGHQPQIYETNTPYILKLSLIGSRWGLNPVPFDLELPTLPSELPGFAKQDGYWKQIHKSVIRLIKKHQQCVQYSDRSGFWDPDIRIAVCCCKP